MSDVLTLAIQSVQQSSAAWCRYITSNDVGSNGSHQSGFYVPKCASPLLFATPGQKGENKEKDVIIRWQNEFTTNSKMKYYGQGTRNEYRITKFGKKFPFLQDNNVGDLLVIAKHSEEEYSGYVLGTDDDIDGFLSFFNLSPNQTNHLIELCDAVSSESQLSTLLSEFVAKFKSFPKTNTMSEGAMNCYNQAYNLSAASLRQNPDAILLHWIDTEYTLFKLFEEKTYSDILLRPFKSVEELIKKSNEILNRRKSRAGKSLEHHLANIFTANDLLFEEQATTEDKKKPDFIFPNGKCYHNLLFPTGNITILGAKTSCKDRWRQVLTEADRVDDKYLFTMQQGISRNQLIEMRESKLHLVVPKQYISSFPKEHQSEIKTLSEFICLVREKQNNIPKHFVL